MNREPPIQRNKVERADVIPGNITSFKWLKLFKKLQFNTTRLVKVTACLSLTS